MFYQKFTSPDDQLVVKWFERIVVGIILFCLFWGSLFIVSPGERAVVVRLGAIQRINSEGLGFKIPLFEKRLIFDIKTVKLERDALCYSKDIQTVDTKLALNFHLYPDKVATLYQEVGRDFVERLIDPAIQESLKASTAQFTAQQLIEERPKVKDEIKMQLTKRLEKYFVIDEFSIIDFSFSDEYEKAIESKQVSQQSALKAENDLKRIEIEAEQRIAQAKAEAQAIQIQAQAINSQGGADYVSLQAISKWNGVLPTYMFGNSTPFINIK